MIRFRFKERLAEKEFKEKRRITIDEVSKATKISRNTLSRISNTFGYSTSTDVLDKLCQYFECDIKDIVEYQFDAGS